MNLLLLQALVPKILFLDLASNFLEVILILGEVVELKDIDFSPGGCQVAIADILEKVKQLEAIWIVHGDERTMSLRELAEVFRLDFTTLYRWRWDIINISPQLLGVYESSQMIERRRLGAHQRFFYLLIWVLRDKDLLGYRPLSHQEISCFLNFVLSQIKREAFEDWRKSIVVNK